MTITMMNKRLWLLTLLLLSLAIPCAAQITQTLASGGVGVSCNATTTATSVNPGLAGGCVSFNLLTSGGQLPTVFTWQVSTTGSPTGLAINLMGSLDNVTWTQIDTTSIVGGRSVNLTAYRFIGCVPATLSGGTSPTVSCQISVSGGGPINSVIVGTVDLSAQAAAISSANLYAVPTGGAGSYLVTCYVVLTQAATSTSTLPVCNVNWTDADTGIAQTAVPLTPSGLTGNTIGLTGTKSGWLGTQIVQAAAGTTITISTTNYASSGVTPMQYALHAKAAVPFGTQNGVLGNTGLNPPLTFGGNTNIGYNTLQSTPQFYAENTNAGIAGGTRGPFTWPYYFSTYLTASSTSAIELFDIAGQVVVQPASIAAYTSELSGIHGECDHNGSGLVALCIGSSGEAYALGSVSPATVLAGITGEAGTLNAGTGAVGTINGGLFVITTFGSNTATNGYGLHVYSPQLAGTVSHYAGLQIDDPTPGGAANPAPLAISVAAGNSNLGAGTVTLGKEITNTNCAVNSVSPAACSAAASGAVVVPTTTTTYTVNTSAAVTGSRIFLQPISFASNLPSAPTCVAPAVTSAVTISAISTGVSFTFSLPSTSGQTCWEYWIVD